VTAPSREEIEATAKVLGDPEAMQDLRTAATETDEHAQLYEEIRRELGLAEKQRDGAIKRDAGSQRKLARLREQSKALTAKVEHYRYELRRLEGIMRSLLDLDGLPTAARERIEAGIPSALKRTAGRGGPKSDAARVVWLEQLLTDSENEVVMWQGQHREAIRAKRATHAKAQEFYARAKEAETALDSLKLELAAEKHCHRRDNEELIRQRDTARRQFSEKEAESEKLRAVAEAGFWIYDGDDYDAWRKLARAALRGEEAE
jgi:hypothetical protein